MTTRNYTGIDIGSDSIKMVVSERIQNEFHILAATSLRSTGVKRGVIQDVQMVASSIKLAKKEIERQLGMPLRRAIVSVPPQDCVFNIVTGEIKLEEGHIVEGDDIVKVLRDALLGQVPEDRELVTVMPIGFDIGEEEQVKDPKGIAADHLGVKAVITTIPKENFRAVLAVMEEAEIEVVDVTFPTTGDYYETRKESYDRKVGAIINLGAETTTVSIFNKGIMIKMAVLEIGSRHIDHDISYIYKVDQALSRQVKETFAAASSSYSDYNDVMELADKEGTKLLLNQGELSEVVESRLKQILKLAKKEINLLTNREISYIIITGGSSELVGFPYLVNDSLGKKAVTWNMTTMGARSNQYASVLGMIKYFHEKLSLRGQVYTMMEKVGASDKSKPTEESPSIISRVFRRS